MWEPITFVLFLIGGERDISSSHCSHAVFFFGSYRKQPTMKGGHHTEAGPSSLRTLIYDDAADQPTLEVLDQLLIPDKKEYIKIPNVETAWSVIRNMNIRGRYNTMTSHQGTSRERYDHLSTFSH